MGAADRLTLAVAAFVAICGMVPAILAYLQSRQANKQSTEAAMQAQRAAAQSFKNEGHLHKLGLEFNGKVDLLLHKSKALDRAEGNAEGRAESTLELAAAAKTVLDDAKERGE